MQRTSSITMLLAAAMTSSVGLVAGGCAGVETESGVCERAADHIEQCLGHVHAGGALDCDPGQAAGYLALSCDEIRAEFDATGEDLKTDWDWGRALACWFGAVPLDTCMPGPFRGYTQVGNVQRARGTDAIPIEGVTIRFQHATLSKVVVSATSDPHGWFAVKVPGTAFRAQPYRLEVVVDGNVIQAESVKINFGFLFDVRFSGDAVTVCRWRDDDWCASPAEW